ncbi:FAD-dependent oxidoreductase [Kribbella sp. NPDC051770]|uniref:NAD(P)/FAD-dependent oxidoreductase n=1 Tax=Kribbella sp. NPDC051770 TaxID=3155413 RepID=UPI0034281D57
MGASAAGSTTAQTLRREGFAGAITVIGDEPHLPYDRPPLSKQVLLGSWPAERTSFGAGTTYAEQGIDLRLATRATGLDLARREVALSTGEALGWDHLVVATGVQPVRLSDGHQLAGVHVLRTLDDAVALRKSLVDAASVVVVGAGFLGSETAAAARQLGCEVTLVDLAPAPLAVQLGAELGWMLAELHAANGVRVVGGSGVTRLLGESAVEGVELSDGSVVKADAVLVAVGSRPVTDWLDTSGLPCGDGVLCDEAPAGVHAAGDVARWTSPRFGTSLRLEHRFNATEQAVWAARRILGQEVDFDPIPYFWTDQYDARIQVYGVVAPDARMVVVAGDPAARKFLAHYVSGGRVSAVLGWNMPRELRSERALLTAI